MSAYGVKLPEEYKQKAIANNLSLQTVYGRINRGWDLEKAVTTPPKLKTAAYYNQRDSEGNIKSGKRPKGKNRTFTAYADMDQLLDDAIADSGLSSSDFLAIAVEDYLTKLWKPKSQKPSKRKDPS